MELADGDWEWKITYWKFIAMDYLVVNAEKKEDGGITSVSVYKSYTYT